MSKGFDLICWTIILLVAAGLAVYAIGPGEDEIGWIAGALGTICVFWEHPK